VPGGLFKSPNLEAYTTAMNLSQREGLGADGIMANDRGRAPPIECSSITVADPRLVLSFRGGVGRELCMSARRSVAIPCRQGSRAPAGYKRLAAPFGKDWVQSGCSNLRIGVFLMPILAGAHEILHEVGIRLTQVAPICSMPVWSKNTHGI
jgi:hypothetical protein